MKIAFVLDNYPSLTETFIARDISALRRLGLDIHVFALHAGADARPIQAPPPLSSLWLRGAWEKARNGERENYFKALGARWWSSLGEEARTFDHIHAGWASHPALIAWGAAQTSGLTWSFSGHARDLFVEGGDLAGKLAAARFAAVCTRAGAAHLREISAACAEKVIYAPHGIEVGTLAFQDWTPTEMPLILAVGRLVEKKGFLVLLDALSILRAQDFTFHAQVLGDGPLRNQLAARRDHLGLQNCVRFSGAVAQHEVMNLMRAASCLAVPSLIAGDGDRDGLPNVVLEAAAVGLPIVATRAGAIEEFVSEDTGWLCLSGNAESLAEALRAVSANEDITRSRCRAARTKVEHDFDVMQNAKFLSKAFFSLKLQ